MTINCRKAIRMIDHWLELSPKKIDALKNHTKRCEPCRQALASLEATLAALDRSAKTYDRISYTGPMPTPPKRQPAFWAGRSFLPKVGWATALAATICLLVWFGSQAPLHRDTSRHPSMAGALRIPAMPIQKPVRISMPMTPGALGMRITRPRHSIGASLQRHMRMPQKPKKRPRHKQKMARMQQLFHA